MKKLMMMVAAALAGHVFAADEAILVGSYQRETLSVPTDAVQVAPISKDIESTVDKVGAGTLTLPVSSLRQGHKFALTVREGKVLFPSTPSDGAYTDVEAPEVVTNKATVWMSATENVICDDGSHVSEWRDVRETYADGAYHYRVAKPAWGSEATDLTGPLCRTVKGGRKSLYFGKFNGAGKKYMLLKGTDGTTTSALNARHVFAVHSVSNSFGYVVSHNSSSAYHVGNTGGSVSSVITVDNPNDAEAQKISAFYYDGVRVDPHTTYIHTGPQLFEYMFSPHETGSMNAYFTDRAIAKRQGGDDLCEVIAFTSSLTERERMSVQRYLMEKWALGSVPAQVEFDVAKGAEATIDVPAESSVPVPVTFAGEGTVAKTGEGELFLAVRSNGVFRGEVDLRAGTILTEEPVPLKVVAGSRATAAVTSTGERLSMADDAGAESVVKDGNGTVELQRLPADVKSLKVEGGRLVLRADDGRARFVSGGDGRVVITNGDFEATTPQNTWQVNLKNTTVNGWTGGTVPDGNTSQASPFYFNRSATNASTWPCNYDSVNDGKTVLALKWDAYAKTRIHVPVDGQYAIAFQACARYAGVGTTYWLRLNITLTPDRGAEIPISQTINLADGEYKWQRYVTPVLTAGDYTLMFAAAPDDVDGLTLIDDLEMKLVTDTAAADDVKVPNGGFEYCDRSLNPTITRALTNAVGWTFSDFLGKVDKNNAPCPPAAIVRCLGQVYDSGNGNPPATKHFEYQDGNAALGLFSDMGSATTTFTAPKDGLYRLKAQVGCVKLNYLYSLAETPRVSAVLSSDSIATPLVLGKVAPKDWRLRNYLWAEPFKLVAGENVTITLSNEVHLAAAMVDNLVFEPVESESFEYVRNGGFEADTDWTYGFFTDQYGDHGARRLAYTQLQAYFGYSRCAGDYFLNVGYDYAATQEIAFPKAGTYRLSLSLCPRVDKGTFNTGRNNVRAFLARGSETNDICTIPFRAVTNFVRTAYLFKVPAAGTYTFGLAGTTPNTDVNTRVDEVSIRAAMPRADATELSNVPEMADDVEIAVAQGATLSLEFTGVKNVKSIHLGGHRVSGDVSAATHPQYLTGPGTLHSDKQGLVIIVE